MNNVRVKVRVAASGGAVLGGGRNIGHRAAAGRGSVSAVRDNTASTSHQPLHTSRVLLCPCWQAAAGPRGLHTTGSLCPPGAGLTAGDWAG